MKYYDINSLNDEQKLALYETDGVVLVTAGAGSGKTRLLTHRIGYLLEKGVSSYNILAITFTNKATNEMKERVAQMTDKRIWISTFHSMCVRILREEIEILPGYTKNFSIIDDSDQEKIVKDLCKRYQGDDEEKDRVLAIIGTIKNKGIDIEDYFNGLYESNKNKNLKIYKKICYDYEEYLSKSNSLDFDDLLNKTLFLFNNYGEILDKYATRFEYILVDEFQDTNLVQYKLIKLLSSKHKNLFVVGDEDQCIYSWRGANFQNIFNLEKDFDNVKVFKLERNYRSTKNILNLANNVIANNKERMKKNLWTEKDYGDGPVVLQAFDERDEAMYVAGTIEELVSKGYSYEDFAVLMRVNALSRPIEEAFMAMKLPYKLYGGFRFYERAEVKIVLAYLNLFVNPKDEISLLKIINFPKRGIGDSAISALKIEAGDKPLFEYLLSDKFTFSKYYSKLDKFVSTFEELKELQKMMPIADFAGEVVKRFAILPAIAGKEADSDKVGNIDSLLAGIREFEEDNEGVSLSDYLANIMLKSDSDNIQEGGYISLATIHAVKGLEFKVVFIVGLEEGIFPLARANFSASEMEEERRLMYVAITRAEEKIYLLHATKRFMYGKSNYQKESRFLSELNIVDRSKVGGGVETYKSEGDVFESGYAVGDKVFLPRFGEGKLIEISDDGLVGKILFEQFGMKEIMLNSKSLEKVDG